MTNDERNPKSESSQVRRSPISDLPIHRSWIGCHSAFLFFAVSVVVLRELTPLFAAAPAQARFAADRAWTTEEGLPDNSVFSLLQTRDGYLWMGTGDGLARFDGIHFRTFEDVDARGLNRGKIVSLFEDTNGSIWIGTETAGILILDSGGKLTRLGETGAGAERKLVTAC